MREQSLSPQKYLTLLLSLILSGLLALAGLSFYVQPLEGDLTRMGGYAERDFGNNIPRQLLAGDIVLSNAYDKYYDVVVIGDSFSRSGLWQSYLRQKTGYSFTTLHWDNASLETVMANPIFKQSPPKLVIAEIGVRDLPFRFAGQKAECVSEPPEKFVKGAPLAFVETPVEFVDVSRPTVPRLEDINMKFALFFLENKLLRIVFHGRFDNVKSYPLTRADLFSNRKSDEILLLQTWFDEKLWTEAEISNAICRTLDLQARVQANGKTMFILLPIPGKNTAYAKYIAKPDFANTESTNQAWAVAPINAPRLDKMLEKAIDSGEKDVYLPNDTHFGTRGYQLAAAAVVDFLAGQSASGTFGCAFSDKPGTDY
jgi:hypothetical protein